MEENVHVVQALDPLVERQIRNEKEIIDKGITEYRNALQNAQGRGEYADTMPGRWLTANFIEPVVCHIRGFVSDYAAGKPGPQAGGAAILDSLDYDACAYIAIRNIVNSVVTSNGEHVKAGVAARIAQELTEEFQHNYMRKERRQTYRYWMKQYQQAAHRETKKNCLKKLRNNFPALPDYKSEDARFAIAAASEALIRFVIEATGIARLTRRVKGGRGRVKTPDFLELTPEFYGVVEKTNARAETLWPKYDPMVCPPRPWTGAYKGGFVGPLGDRTILVRTGNYNYLEEIHHNTHKMDKVLRALNAVQATPWRINRKIHGVMREAFAGRHGQHYGLPGSEKIRNPPVPPDIKTDKAVSQRWVDKLRVTQRQEKIRSSRYRSVTFLLDTADKYVDEDAIYFAHNLDWRGRIYPLSSYLSPQGEELHRALLEFANGKALETQEAADWLAVHGAGCWGYDKVAFPDRIAWVRENEMWIRASADDPFNCDWWVQADKPWMFLAWCMDWAGYLDHGLAHVSRLPVAMDGSCNGLQNFAAMMRCPETAAAVNLTPGDIPHDIYQQVADKVTARLKDIAASDPRSSDDIIAVARERTELEFKGDEDRTKISLEERLKTAALWGVVVARWMEGHVTRKLVKRPVMTYPYSVTIYGIRDQLLEMLLGMAGEIGYPDKHEGKIADALKRVVMEEIEDTVIAAAEAMRWLRDAAEVVAKGNLPVTWTSPIGMPVMQNYWKSGKKKVSVSVGGIQYRASCYAQRVGEVRVSKQRAGVAPNFVHSCDASHLMFTVLAGRDEGITDFHMIHDSYGTHARNTGALARILREQFVALYSGKDMLADFREQLRRQLAHKPDLADKLPEPPALGDFDLNRVLKSKYFFA